MELFKRQLPLLAMIASVGLLVVQVIDVQGVVLDQNILDVCETVKDDAEVAQYEQLIGIKVNGQWYIKVDCGADQ
jgi:hypothetical protein